MKREAYLATLTFVTALLLSELENEGTEFGLTKPPWIGAVSWLVSLISHYAILGAIVLCIVTAFSALATGTPTRIVPPTVLTGVGAAFYLANSGIEDIMQWFNFERLKLVVDGVEVAVGYGTIPDEYKWLYYACNAVPFWAFLLFIIPYAYYTVRLHHADKTKLAARGIKYNDSEQAGIVFDAEAPGMGMPMGVTGPLTVLLRGDRHGSGLPGLYAPVRA